jgi:DNA polymerase I - 3''-5'' exonuclease and polymerase domains
VAATSAPTASLQKISQTNGANYRPFHGCGGLFPIKASTPSLPSSVSALALIIFIPEIDSPNRQVREAAERMAINMPVQGTSADIIKVAMINLNREMDKRRLKSKMLLQVHDELIFEVPQDELKEMRQLVPKLMSTALQLSIPLKVDIKTGNNWGEME